MSESIVPKTVSCNFVELNIYYVTFRKENLYCLNICEYFIYYIYNINVDGWRKRWRIYMYT